MSAWAGDLALAERVAREAGALLMERYDGPARGVESKSTRTDMVSDADRDAEGLIQRLLAEERPRDGLLAEEGASSEGTSGRRWVVDPLDGTTNYLYRLPAWAVSVALEEGDGAVVGVVHDPLADETFSAVRGEGALLDGAPIAVGGAQALDTALIATGFYYAAAERERQARLLVELLPRVRDVRRVGAAALDLCMVACGRVDGYYERGLNRWDWSAAALVAGEAGASVRSLPGEPFGLCAAAPGIADELAALVGG
jgi:fructose-1,6-bisphosphatase/inositol monophosphatase family enzyme